MMKPIYNKPKLVKSANGWYVYFRFEGKAFRYKYGFNRIENLKVREHEFNLLCSALYQKLRNGWNPNFEDVGLFSSSMTLEEALDFALSKKKESLSKNSYSGYNLTAKYFKEAARRKNLIAYPLAELKRVHIRLIFDDVKKNRKWTNKAYNKNLGYLKALFSELLQWDLIETNPVHQIKSLKVSETLANRTATDEELLLIKDKLLKSYPSF